MNIFYIFQKYIIKVSTGCIYTHYILILLHTIHYQQVQQNSSIREIYKFFLAFTVKVAYDKSRKNPIRSKTRIIRPHNASPRSRLGTRYFLIKRRPYGPVKNLESIIKSASVRYYIVAKTPGKRIRCTSTL